MIELHWTVIICLFAVFTIAGSSIGFNIACFGTRNLLDEYRQWLNMSDQYTDWVICKTSVEAFMKSKGTKE